MPRNRSRSPKLDWRYRLIVRAVGTRVDGVYQIGPVVFDSIVWAGKPESLAQFDVTEHGIQIEAKETLIVRAFTVRQNGETEPAVQPYPAGTEFLAVGPDDLLLFVSAVDEIGRNRFLELTVEAVSSPIPSGLAGITYAGGVPS